MIKEAIARLANREDIGYETAKEVMNEIMSGEASDIQKSAYLTALSMKGETIEEITGSAEEMRNHCVRLLNDMDVLEIVGTGGDRSNSFNISTTSALVIAAGGVPGGKARKPGSLQQMRRCGCPRGSGSEYHNSTGQECRAVKGYRYLLLICPEIPYGHEVCGACPQGTGNPYYLQYPGTSG